jgi:hypothetical protein
MMSPTPRIRTLRPHHHERRRKLQLPITLNVLEIVISDGEDLDSA